MIFSQSKWSTDSAKVIVHASAALSYETMETPLSQAWYMFITPLFGDFADEIVNIYNDENPTDLQKKVLELAQTAVANLALWYNFSELNARLTDQGHQRQETDNFKSLYKYQEDAIKNGYRNKGFNAIDTLLALLDANTDTFTTWVENESYIRRHRSIVQSVEEVNKVVFINSSSIIFMRMLPIFEDIDQAKLPMILGQSLYDEFKSLLGSETTTIGDTTVEELRVRIGRVMINLAAAQLIRESGTLTDRGLYFESLTAGKEGNTTAAIPADPELRAKAAAYELKAHNQINSLNAFIENEIPDLFGGRPSATFKRDNDNKHSVWL